MSTTIATVAGVTGYGTSRQIVWAEVGQLWWAFAWTGTATLASWSSPDGVTWTARATTTYANHGSNGVGLTVGYANIGGQDTFYFFQSDNCIGTLVGHGANIMRGTASGITLTYHTLITTLTSAVTDGSGGTMKAGGSALYGTDGKVYLSSGPLNSYDVGAARSTTTDPGTAEQMTALAWTLDSIDIITAQNRSAFLVNLGSSQIGLLADDGASPTGTTGISWYIWNGSAWTGSAGNQLATGAITSIDKNDWGAVEVNNGGVHLVYRNASGTLTHRIFNGTSWANGQTIPTQGTAIGDGVALTSDGTSVWLCVLGNDAATSVRFIQWDGVLKTWGVWQTAEPSTATRSNIGCGPKVVNQTAMVYWTEGATSYVATTFSAVPDPLNYNFIQAKQGFVASASTLNIQFDNNVAAGNRIIVMIGVGNNVSSALSGISDSGSNAYNADRDNVGIANHNYIRSAVVSGGGGTRITVTVNISGGPDTMTVWIAEYSGTLAVLNAVDVSGAFDSGTSSPATAHSATTSAATTAPNELVLFYNHDDGVGGTQTGVNGLTVRGADTTNTFTSSFGDKVGTGGATQTGNITIANSLNYTGTIVVYKLAPTAQPSGLPIQPGATWKRRFWKGLQNPIPGVLASSGPLSNLVTATDSLSAMSESATRVVALPRSFSDSLTALSDTATRTVSAPRSAPDPLDAPSDSSARILSLLRTPTDTLAAPSDIATRSALSYLRTALDALASMSDAATRMISFPRLATDTLSALSDTANMIKVVIRNATDALGAMSETVIRIASLPRSFSDSLPAISDTPSRILTLPRTSIDSLSALLDAATRLVSLPRPVVDTLGALSDTATRVVLAFLRTSLDALSAISDNATRSVSFPRTALDNLPALSDTISRILSLPRTATDALGALSETATRTILSFSRTASDSLSSLSDTAIRLTSFSRAATDSLAAMSDTAAMIKVVIRNATDSLSALSDTASRTALAFSRSATDNLATLADVPTRLAQGFLRSTNESLAAMSDAANVIKVIVRSTTDALAALSDSAARVVLHPRSVSDSLSALAETATRSAQTFLRTTLDNLPSLADAATVGAVFLGTPARLFVSIRDGSLKSKVRDGVLNVFIRDSSRKDKTRG